MARGADVNPGAPREAAMPAETPGCTTHTTLGPLSSRYVDVGALEWTSTGQPGVDWKILFKDEARGLMTALVRFEPGAALDLHEHTDIEQSYMLEGSLEDTEGACRAGDFVWRPKGSRHRASAPDGALMLAVFQSPNIFLEGPKAAAER
jgi:anti-sigma factor ChrR (cupin superfamily)